MEGRLLLKNCSVFRSDGRLRDGLAVLVENGRITRVAPDADLPVRPGDWEVACHGRLVTPGLIDCHTHLVSGQLVPLSGELVLRPKRMRTELRDAMEAALTADDVGALTRHALAKAARQGVTMLVEHLHCPNDTTRALEAQAQAATELGLRLVVSHATRSTATGAGGAEAQADANAAFARDFRSHPLVRGAVGFQSSATADDALLRRIGRVREELGVGAHFHLAENEEDLLATFAAHGRRVVPRLESFGLLGPGTVASYANAVDRAEAERLARSRTLIALSPRLSQLTDPTGTGMEAVYSQQNLLGLGTAGVGSLWEELTAALAFTVQTARVGRLLDPDGMMAQLLVGGPAELCSMHFGAPSGSVEEGCLADLVVHDLYPPREALEGKATHFLYELGRAPVAWTIVAGRVLVREGKLLSHEEGELAAAANERLVRLWAKR